MASNRHLGRIVALQSLYEYDFRVRTGDSATDINEIISRNLNRYKDTIDDLEFVETLIRGTVASFDALDESIQPLAPEWPLSQIARIDHNILRLAMYELFDMKDSEIPSRVTINEAVELAKSFGSINSSKFINGVLGTAWRKSDEGASGDDQSQKLKGSVKKSNSKELHSSQNSEKKSS